MITIVDYGMANLRSVQKAFEKVGQMAAISFDPQVIRRADRLVLPGVGAFGDGMRLLRERDLDDAICDFLVMNRPFLGICLGMQLLMSRGFEDGEQAGLGILTGDVLRLPPHPGLKIPHMGWNTLCMKRDDCPLLDGIPEGAATYFVHSYYAHPTEESWIAATTDYPRPFAAVFWRDNLFATQFHPEKSQGIGLAMLRNFAKL